jgi:hypothetical protein
MQQHKIPMSTIQNTLRVLEDAPACVTKEVTKVEAMRLLLPQIRAMQAKGYAVAHIANVLSETGISLTEVTLKNYLHRLKVPADKGPTRRGKQTVAIDRPTLEDAPKSPAPKLNQAGGESGPPASPRRESVGPSGAALPEARSGTSSDSAESPRRIMPPSPQDTAARRAGFTVRPDTKNI